jgi:hypothetical protein
VTRILAYPIMRCRMTPKGLTRWLILPTIRLPVCPATRKTSEQSPFVFFARVRSI